MANEPSTDEPAGTLRVGDVARRAGVSPDTVRYYERLGLLDPPPRSAAGYRLYGPDALERVAFVRKARALGLTLSQVSDILRASLEDAPPCDHVRATLTARLEETETRIGELEALRNTLRQALHRARELPPVTSCVCGIIESHPLPEDQS